MFDDSMACSSDEITAKTSTIIVNGKIYHSHEEAQEDIRKSLKRKKKMQKIYQESRKKQLAYSEEFDTSDEARDINHSLEVSY